LQLDASVVGASDTDASAIAFMTENFQVQHLYDTMESQMASHKPCLTCRAKKTPKNQGKRSGPCFSEEPVLDMFVAGLPCQPYSLQRVKHFCQGSVKSHKSYDTCFGQFFEWLDFHNPSCGVFENVKGFGEAEDHQGSTSPLDRPGTVTVVPTFF
jgi:site-specific DNA-cytosine methylase